MKITELAKSKPIVYVDMDGVLADLYGYAATLHDVAHYNDMTPDQWEKFFKESNAYHLFRDISPFPNANQLLQSVKDQSGGYTILSSPLNFDREGSIKGKCEWLKKYITVPADKHIFDHEKYNYAVQPNGTPNILIDDYGPNIDAWNKAGGIALKFQNDEDSLDTLLNRLQKALKQDK